MIPVSRIYRVLLVSAARSGTAALLPFFQGEKFGTVTVETSVSQARRRLVDMEYDLVIINTPLPDDFGRKLAADVSAGSGKVALLLVRADLYGEICAAMMPAGVLVAKKPIDASTLEQFLNVMCSVRERLRGLAKKTVTLEQKMEEIRLVNRAKWALIRSCQMSEEDAHRYIQKQAMDLCLDKREAAERILRIYDTRQTE